MPGTNQLWFSAFLNTTHQTQTFWTPSRTFAAGKNLGCNLQKKKPGGNPHPHHHFSHPNSPTHSGVKNFPTWKTTEDQWKQAITLPGLTALPSAVNVFFQKQSQPEI